MYKYIIILLFIYSCNIPQANGTHSDNCLDDKLKQFATNIVNLEIQGFIGDKEYYQKDNYNICRLTMLVSLRNGKDPQDILHDLHLKLTNESHARFESVNNMLQKINDEHIAICNSSTISFIGSENARWLFASNDTYFHEKCLNTAVLAVKEFHDELPLDK